MSTAETNLEDRPQGLLQGVADLLVDLGEVVIQAVESVGDITLFGLRTVSWMFTRLPSSETLFASLYQIGVRSLPVVALTGTFIGMVLAVQAYYQFHTFGMETRLGAMINLSMYRELGPVLAATMLAGRIGSAIAAELGTMRVTEQIDALESLGANPIRYLVVPRLAACLLMIPALTIMAMLMGVAGGAFYCISIYDVDSFFYFNNASQAASAWDVCYGVVKSFFFGGAIAVISCYRGFNCSPGAEGVGRASTIAFVQSFVVILVMDLALSIMLDNIYYFVWPEEAF